MANNNSGITVDIVSSDRVKSYAKWVEPLTRIGDCKGVENHKTIEGTFIYNSHHIDGSKSISSIVIN